ncbi:MAG: hypothetical protein QOJ23_3420 [Actinomycetota bacterium]|nr:hypothetical protein [Actinomycetota bacterium]
MQGTNRAATRGLPELIISVDDHIIEPPDVWEARLPAGLRERGPRVVETDRGQAWEIDGERRRIVGIAASANRNGEDRFSMKGVRYSEIMPGAYDAKARLADMDEDGVAVQILFDNLPGFAGATFLELAERDPELALACVRAYNDWLAADWCATAPTRLIPQCILPLWDLSLSADEVSRAAELGHRGVLLPGVPAHLDLPAFSDAAWHGVFRSAEDAGIPIVMHIGGTASRKSQVTDLRSEPDPVALETAKAMTPLVNCEALAGLMFAGVPELFPNLKMVSAEAGIGWWPYLSERLDEIYTKHRLWEKTPLTAPPSEYLARQVYASFILDDAGMASRELIGRDRIMWSSDYPHADSTWPNSRQLLTEHYGQLPEEDLTAILGGNALAVYGLTVPAEARD